MHLSTAVTLFAAVAVAKPFTFPLSNGFPKLNPKTLAKVQKQAGGTLPNTPLPKKLTKEAIATFELVAAQETFEVAYFTNLLENIKSGNKTFKKGNTKKVKSAIHAIRAQEELHATAANAILESAGEKPVAPCKYNIPQPNFEDAIALAQTFTDVVLGVLPVAQELFGMDGGQETGLVKLIGSILGQEAEQVGYFRTLAGKNPSAAPFLSGTTPEFAYSALKMFIVKGSCPRIENLPIPSFKPITVLNPPSTPKNAMVKMQVAGPVSAKKHSVTYISGQNKPVTVPIKSVKMAKGVSTFEVSLPFVSKGFANGLSLAAVTKKGKKFSSATQVPGGTVYGPGLLEIG